MSQSDLIARYKLFLQREFFDAQTCDEIVAAMHTAPGEAASVHGRGASSAVDERARKTTRLAPSAETVEFVRRRLLEGMGPIGEHFQIGLSACEEPQFLRYQTGDFFVAHQDGNTGMTQFDRDRVRRISAVIFLSQQSQVAESETPAPGTYGGGSLVFSGWTTDPGCPQLHLAGETGMLVAFRAETTHEVLPVTHGERYSIACWYR